MVGKKGYGPNKLHRYSEEQVAEALRKSNGLMSHTAKRLKVSVVTMYNYVNLYPALIQIAKEATEANIDQAESSLQKQVRKGNMTAICFLLKTKGKGRGYVEHDQGMSLQTFRRIVEQMGRTVLKYVKNEELLHAIEQEWAQIPMRAIDAAPTQPTAAALKSSEQQEDLAAAAQ